MMFLIVGIAGMLISFTRLQKPVCRELGPEGTVPHGPLGSSASYNSYIAFLLRLCYNP